MACYFCIHMRRSLCTIPRYMFGAEEMSENRSILRLAAYSMTYNSNQQEGLDYRCLEGQYLTEILATLHPFYDY